MSWLLRGTVLVLAMCVGSANAARASMCIGVDYRTAGQRGPGSLVRAMQDEASAIWKEYGVRLVWADRDHPVACERVDATFEVVVRRGSEQVPALTKRVVLGRTHLEPAAIDHTQIHLEYDAVERTLRLLPRTRLLELAATPYLGPRELGRALGRVLAHEIGHVLLNLRDHPLSGLMRRAFEPAELVGFGRWSFTLSPGEIEHLRTRERFLDGRIAQAPAAAPSVFPGRE